MHAGAVRRALIDKFKTSWKIVFLYDLCLWNSMFLPSAMTELLFLSVALRNENQDSVLVKRIKLGIVTAAVIQEFLPRLNVFLSDLHQVFSLPQ